MEVIKQMDLRGDADGNMALDNFKDNPGSHYLPQYRNWNDFQEGRKKIRCVSLHYSSVFASKQLYLVAIDLCYLNLISK